jgi:drug/metabolite transporter (DMT)-like permease
MASFFVLFGMIAFGVSNVIWKPLLPKMTVNTMLFRRSCWSAGLILVLFLAGQWICLRPEWYLKLTESENYYPIHESLLRSVGSILISLLGLYLFIHSLKHQPAGISGMIVCISTLLSAFLGWSLLHEPFHWELIFSLSISLLGVLMMDRTGFRTLSLNKGIAWALLGACCWGIANLGFKKMIPETGVLQFSLMQESVVVLVSGIGLLGFGRQEPEPPDSTGIQVHLLIFVISLLTILGVLFCNLGMSRLPVSRFALLVLAQPLATFVIADLWLKEKTTWSQKFGAFLILAGIYTGTAFA